MRPPPTLFRPPVEGAAPTLTLMALSPPCQVILPEGYLAGVYAEMRAAGAVCVADEVQCGFGRVGRSFWAFELQGVVPDIVTFGELVGGDGVLGMPYEMAAQGGEVWTMYSGRGAPWHAGRKRSSAWQWRF